MKFQIRNMNFSYNSAFSIRDVSLKFSENVTMILGPNGSGKSTLIKCLTNQLAWDGTIRYDSCNIVRSNKQFFRGKIGYLPQVTYCDSTLSVYEVVLLGLMNQLSLSMTNEQQQVVSRLLNDLELSDISNHRICDLSGGQRQMVYLAQALIKEPEILILDEPLNNLDIKRQFQLLDFVSRITKSKKIITIVIMHDINLAARYADKIVIMKNGKIYSQGTPLQTITQQMIREVYDIQCEIFEGQEGHILTEFIGLHKAKENYSEKISLSI